MVTDAGEPLTTGSKSVLARVCFHSYRCWGLFEQQVLEVFSPGFVSMVTDGVVLADPSLEERGFPSDVLMEDMIPTLKLVIRAVRSARKAPPLSQTA